MRVVPTVDGLQLQLTTKDKRTIANAADGSKFSARQILEDLAQQYSYNLEVDVLTAVNNLEAGGDDEARNESGSEYA